MTGSQISTANVQPSMRMAGVGSIGACPWARTTRRRQQHRRNGNERREERVSETGGLSVRRATDQGGRKTAHANVHLERYSISVLKKEHRDGGDSLRIPASGGRLGRLAKLALIPAAGLACSRPAGTRTRPTTPATRLRPALFGETANGIGFPHEVVTTEGIASASLYLPIFLIAVVIFVLIEGLLLFMVPALPPQGHRR